MTDQKAKKKPRPHKPRTGHPRNFSSDPDRATRPLEEEIEANRRGTWTINACITRLSGVDGFSAGVNGAGLSPKHGRPLAREDVDYSLLAQVLTRSKKSLLAQTLVSRLAPICVKASCAADLSFASVAIYAKRFRLRLEIP